MKFNEYVDMSMREGSTFKFPIGGELLIYKANSVSGKEMVSINGDVLSESQNYKLKSGHEFTYKGCDYKLLLEVKNLRKGDIECALFEKDALIKRYKLKYVKNDRYNTLKLALILFGGVGLGAAYSSDLIGLWATGAIVFLLAITSAAFNDNKWECSEEFGSQSD